MDDNKQKALAAALSQIEKQYGKGSIMKMDAEAIKDIEVVSTGSPGRWLGPAPGGAAPGPGEPGLGSADMRVRWGGVDVIVIGSVAALTPKAEIEGEMGEPQMGLQ